VVAAKYHDGFVSILHALRDLDIFGIGKRRFDREHITSRPTDQAGPHFSDQNQRRLLEMADLKQLPDHHSFQDGTDAARRNHKSVKIVTW